MIVIITVILYLFNFFFVIAFKLILKYIPHEFISFPIYKQTTQYIETKHTHYILYQHTYTIIYHTYPSTYTHINTSFSNSTIRSHFCDYCIKSDSFDTDNLNLHMSNRMEIHYSYYYIHNLYLFYKMHLVTSLTEDG